MAQRASGTTCPSELPWRLRRPLPTPDVARVCLCTHPAPSPHTQKSGIWSTADLQTYTATYVFNYVLAGTYLIMFIVLLLTKGDMQAGEARGEDCMAALPG